MYGILTTLLAGRGSLLTPIATPIAYLPIKTIAAPTFGRISAGDANYAVYRAYLQANHRRAVRDVPAGELKENRLPVMPGLVPGIHVFLSTTAASKTWMAGTSPAMTKNEERSDLSPQRAGRG